MINAKEATSITEITKAKNKLEEYTVILNKMEAQEHKIVESAKVGNTFAFINVPKTHWLSEVERFQIARNYFSSFGYSLHGICGEDQIRVNWDE